MREEIIERVKFYILNNRFQKAKEILQTALKVDKNDKTALFYMGLLNEMLNRYEEAINCYQKVLELDPDHKGAYQHLMKLQQR